MRREEGTMRVATRFLLVLALAFIAFGAEDVIAQEEQRLPTPVMEALDIGPDGINNMECISEYDGVSTTIICYVSELNKSASRIDFHYEITFPGTTLEVGESATITATELNVNDPGDITWEFTSDPHTAFNVGTVHGGSSHTYTVVPDESGEYRFQARIEECESGQYDGTECYRTKLLIVQVGPANQIPPVEAEKVVVEGSVGEMLCADMKWNPTSVSVNDLRFDIVAEPNDGTKSDDDGDRRICYTPPAGFVGSKNFTYHIWRHSAEKFSNLATVTFTWEGQVTVMEITEFTADRTTITVGESVNLTVSVENAEQCFGEGGPSSWDTRQFAANPNGSFTQTFSSGVFNTIGSHELDVMCERGSVSQTKVLTITVQAEDDPLECGGITSFTMNEGDDQHTETSCNAAGLTVSNLRVNGGSVPSWITQTVDFDDVEFRLQPPSGSAGTYRITGDITSSQRSGTDSFDYTVTVTSPHVAPQCTPSNVSFSVPAGSSFSRTIQLSGTGPFSISKSGLPFVGASVNQATVTYTGAPGHGSVGTHSGSITVTGPGGSCTTAITITVTETAQNQPPECVLTGSFNAVAGQPWSFSVKATDPEGHDVKVSLTDGPSGVVITPTSFQVSGSTFTGNWQNPTVGTHTIPIKCEDENGASTAVSGALKVSDGGAGECPDADLLNHEDIPTTIEAGGYYEVDLEIEGNVSLSFDTSDPNRPHTADWLGIRDVTEVYGFAPNFSGHEYHVRIRAINNDHACTAAVYVWNIITTPTSTGIGSDEVPERLALHGNYPNPFNPETTITFDLPTSQHVRLAVYDLMGREVRVLLDERYPAGTGHSVTFDGLGLPSGTYVYRLETPEEVQIGKMILLK